MFITRRRLASLAFVGIFLLGTGVAWADARVGLKISIVHATRDAGAPDPALANIQGDLEKAFGAYKGFKQLDAHELDLPLGQKIELPLPNANTADFTYKGSKGGQHQIHFSVPEAKVDVDLRAPARRLFYQAGLAHEGGILILVLYLKD
ncbi:MAG: hypothetical protein KC620_00440 [Myxococcales bacterium]|nr:hypothetical protein [Myxococcales bacterium]